MILASISGGQSLGKPFPDLSRQDQSLCKGPFSVSCRKSKPFKPSDAVGFDEKSHKMGGIRLSGSRVLRSQDLRRSRTKVRVGRMSAPETIGHPIHASENPRRSRPLQNQLGKVRCFRMNPNFVG
jgi:hypothetical protein